MYRDIYDESRAYRCAEEGGTCECTGRVIYGAQGQFSLKQSEGSIGCNNGVFGDPIVGTRKACTCAPRFKEPPRYQCAEEG